MPLRDLRLLSSLPLRLALAGVLVGLIFLVHARWGEDEFSRLRPLERGAGRVLLEGSWWFPRGGPYILGVSGDGELEIDGEPLALVPREPGARLVRRIYQAGAHRVRARLAPSAHLVWSPPGRRGPPEYVPASSLAPEAPERARFGALRGLFWLEGALVLVLIAGLGGLLLWPLVLRWLAPASWSQRLGGLVVFAVALGIRLWDPRGAGQTWDEDVNWSMGRNHWVALLRGELGAPSWHWNLEHPPWSKYLSGIGALLGDDFTAARALSAVAVALACALLVPVGARLAGRASVAGAREVGVLAGLIAALTPHLVAHGKIVGHEAFAVLWWTLGLWLALRAHDPAGTDRDGAGAGRSDRGAVGAPVVRFVGLGLVFGLALFSRFASGPLALLIGGVLLLGAPPGQRRRTVLLGLAVIAPVALLFGWLSWPRLWSAPLAHLGETLARITRSPVFPEPYLGAIGSRLPWHYFAVYLWATAPLGLLLAAVAGLGRTIRGRGGTATVLLWLLAPLLLTLSPVRRDGVRYILPALPALAYLAALGLHGAGQWLRVRAGRHAARLAPAVALVYLGVVCARIHPYYLDYYGEHVGGPAGVFAARRFEIGWWGEGVAEAVEHVNRHAAPGAVVDRRRVVPSHITWLRGDLWQPQVVDGPFPGGRADWVLVNELAVEPFVAPPWLQLAHEVTAQGAPLVRVYRKVEAGPGSRPRP